MELKQLEYLIAVADNNSMHAASDKLHVSQQNISRTIKQLEEELQVTIFSRTPSGCVLTTEGKNIYNQACVIIQKANDLKNTYAVKISPPPLHGSLQIYFSNQTNLFLDTYLLSFMQQYPHITLTTTELSTESILSAEQQSISFVTISMERLNKYKSYLSQNYSCYLLLSEPLRVIMNKNNPYANQSSISLSKLSKLQFVIFSSSIDKISTNVQAILDHNISLNLKYCSNSTSSLSHFLQQHMAFSLTTKSQLLQSADPSIVSIPIKERIYIAYCFLVPKIPLTPPQQAFYDIFLANTPSTTQKLF